MYKVLQATCQNGRLVLKEKLAPELEGKNIQVILVETDNIKAKKERFFKLADAHSFALPDDYQFNREKLHDR